jgi:hypothetical protein
MLTELNNRSLDLADALYASARAIYGITMLYDQWQASMTFEEAIEVRRQLRCYCPRCENGGNCGRIMQPY